MSFGESLTKVVRKPPSKIERITFQRNLQTPPPCIVVNTDFTGYSVAVQKEHCMGAAGLRGAVYYACSVQVSQSV